MPFDDAQATTRNREVAIKVLPDALALDAAHGRTSFTATGSGTPTVKLVYTHCTAGLGGIDQAVSGMDDAN